jgi:hypothetical protein
MPDLTLTLTTWNLHWARPGTRRGERVANLLDRRSDIAVLTECDVGLIDTGSVVDAGKDRGYTVEPTVLSWAS